MWFKEQKSEMDTRNATFAFTNITKVYVSSSAITDVNNSGAFRVKLPERLRYVYGLELSGFILPNTTCPTFYIFNPKYPTAPGDNFVDFALSTPTVLGTDGVLNHVRNFSFSFPQKSYLYSRTELPGISYTNTLEALLAQALSGDTTYFGNVDFFVNADPLNRTSIEVLGKNALAGLVITFYVLFASGSNSTASAYSQMGFLKNDYTSTLSSNPAISTILVSPFSTIMRPRKFVDVKVQQSPMSDKTVKRVYTSAIDPVLGASEIILNHENRVRLFDKPIDIDSFDISIIMPSGVPSPSVSAFEFEFSCYYLVHEPYKQTRTTQLVVY